MRQPIYQRAVAGKIAPKPKSREHRVDQTDQIHGPYLDQRFKQISDKFYSRHVH